MKVTNGVTRTQFETSFALDSVSVSDFEAAIL